MMDIDQVSNGTSTTSRGGLHFRNYVPSDSNLKSLLLPYKPLKLAGEIAETIVAEADDRIKAFKQQNPLDRLQDDVDIIQQLQPKKPDFDLKRNLRRKLGELDKRTQRAIVEIREAEESESSEDDGGGSGSASSSNESESESGSD